jgi:hypothetical protein
MNSPSIPEPGFQETESTTTFDKPLSVRGECILGYFQNLPEKTRCFGRWVLFRYFPTGIEPNALYPMEILERLKNTIEKQP